MSQSLKTKNLEKHISKSKKLISSYKNKLVRALNKRYYGKLKKNSFAQNHGFILLHT